MLKYTDHCAGGVCLNDGTHPQALLHNLKNKKMKQVMEIENIFTYDATWTPKGNCLIYNFIDLIYYTEVTFRLC